MCSEKYLKDEKENEEAEKNTFKKIKRKGKLIVV
jgi:hypothetical protein